jgi:hypothetical protein
MDFDLLLNADASTASIVNRMLRYNTRCSTNETCVSTCRIGGARQAMDFGEWTP